MIKAEFFVTHNGRLVGFHISGHSGYAQSGSDIVCAFVSSAAYMAANTITDVICADARAEDSDGDMLVRVQEKDADLCKNVLEGLKLHLENTEEQYPDYLTVTYTEV